MYDSGFVTATYIFAVVSIISFLGFTVVVTIGGVIDLIYMFKELEAEVLDETDDGRVVKEDPK